MEMLVNETTSGIAFLVMMLMTVLAAPLGVWESRSAYRAVTIGIIVFFSATVLISTGIEIAYILQTL